MYGKVKPQIDPISLPIDQNISNILDPDIDIFNTDSINFKRIDEEELIYLYPAFVDQQFDSSHIIIFAWLIAPLSVMAGLMFLFNKPLPATALALGTLVPKTEGRPVHYTPVWRFPTHVDVC